MKKAELEKLDDLDEVLKTLEQGERFVITARFGLAGEKPMTLTRVGNYLAITHQRVKEIQNKAIRKLRFQIEKREKAREQPTQLTKDEAAKLREKSREIRARESRNGSDWRKDYRRPIYAFYAAWADQTIAALEAFKRGEVVQMKHPYGSWTDFDLRGEIDRGMIEWRPRPDV